MEILKAVRSDVRKMQGYVSGEQPSGKFIKLNTNENPYLPSPRVVDAIHDAAAGNLNVYPDAMANSFRITAARVFGIDPSSILCGNGSDDLLTILTRTFVSSGSTIRTPTPSYILYQTLAEIQGARFEAIQFNQDWSLPDSFSSPGASIVFLPNPNSPSGTIIGQDKLLAIANSLDCPLVVDEAYGDFTGASAIELIPRASNLIVTRTLSKSYALAGLRFGFAIAHPDVIAELTKVKDSYNCDSLSIAGATAAISDQHWLKENREKILEQRNQLHMILSELEFDVVPSEANFVWCKHPVVESRKIYEQLKQNQILVRYMDYPNWGDGLRISVGTSNQISALATILRSILANN